MPKMGRTERSRRICHAISCAAILMVILTGCSKDQHRWEDHVLIDEIVTLNEDKYKMWPHNQSEAGLLMVEYRLISGPSIDVLFLSESNANVYESMLKRERSCDPVVRNPDLSFSPLARSYTSNWVEVPKGHYYVVAENGDCGTEPPWDGIDNPAKVQVKMVGKKRPVSKWVPKWFRGGG